MWAADIWAFLPIEAEPAQVFVRAPADVAAPVRGLLARRRVRDHRRRVDEGAVRARIFREGHRVAPPAEPRDAAAAGACLAPALSSKLGTKLLVN